MSRFRKFVDFVTDAATFIAGIPAGLTLAGGISKAISTSIAQPKVASAFSKAGSILLKGGIGIGKVYAKGAAIAAKASAKAGLAGAKKLAPVVTTVAKSVPGSRFVPYIIKYAPVAGVAYLSAGMAKQAIKEFGKVKKLTSDSAVDKLSSDKPQFNFQSILNTFRDALLFK